MGWDKSDGKIEDKMEKDKSGDEDDDNWKMLVTFLEGGDDEDKSRRRVRN